MEAKVPMTRNVKRMTYSKFSKLSMEERQNLGADYLILDEFQHCGSPIWGKAIEDFIEENENMKVLGLSATPIRYFDGNINMAERLFGNNIASEISFEEALERGILPKFDYVSALYGFEESERTLRQNIESVDESKREEAIKLYNELHTELGKNVVNLPKILQEHITNKNGKCIVFCKNIEDMQNKIEQAQDLFGCINNKIKTYQVSSEQTDKQNMKALDSFSKDDEQDTLKLMFSVNMMNEGYDLPEVDAVIMMRPTASPALYYQQMGRGIRAGRTNDGQRPVIIDLVGNLDSIKVIEDFSERMKKYSSQPTENTKKQNREDIVRIFDYVRDVNDIIQKMNRLNTKKTLSLKEKIDLFERYLKKEGTSIISDTTYEGYPIGLMLIAIRHELNKEDINRKKYTPKLLGKLEKLGLLEKRHESTIDQKVERLENFGKEHSELCLFIKADYNDEIENYLNNIKDENKREELRKNIELVKKDYRYLAQRKACGKVDESYTERLRNAGIGGVFGYKDEIVELSKKIGLREKRLYELDRLYGGLDKYKEAFINGELKEEIPENERKYYITFFDLANSDFVGRITPKLKLLQDISGYGYYRYFR